MSDFYSKVCVASSLKFNLETEMSVSKYNKYRFETPSEDKFAICLARILERDKEVIALKITTCSNGCIVDLSKNSDWLPSDKEYFKKIEKYLRDISNDAPMSSDVLIERQIFKDFCNDIMLYCGDRFQSRFNKLMNIITASENSQYIKDFINYISMQIEDEVDIKDIANKLNGWLISALCWGYYYKIKKVTMIPFKFKEYIRKIGSYAKSNDIILEVACKEKYKFLFSNITLNILAPVKICQPINSWEDVIHNFISNPNEYKIFKDRCLEDEITANELKFIYGDDLNNKFNNDFYLHAIMNIISNLGKNKKAFIAVSRKCCNLCDLYIERANYNQYDINTIGATRSNKICHRWMFPSTDDINFDIKTKLHILRDLDHTIECEIDHLNRKFHEKNIDWDYYERMFRRIKI
ncbi:hypothetical protein GLOIN_2v1487101 [Rhizophagus clarus]|uniref:Uncharacterized protein n=1 Tax=Rhizophagus clarus TaxID=94130 RepID=A0A8H3R189_9GLOM|nr:hypothetical protein GLOIN_2v1487101 [Rhizophagus clarus]